MATSDKRSHATAHGADGTVCLECCKKAMRVPEGVAYDFSEFLYTCGQVVLIGCGLVVSLFVAVGIVMISMFPSKEMTPQARARRKREEEERSRKNKQEEERKEKEAQERLRRETDTFGDAGDPPGTRDYATIYMYDDEYDQRSLLEHNQKLDEELYSVEKDLANGKGDRQLLELEAAKLREKMNKSFEELIERDRKRAEIERKIQAKYNQLSDVAFKLRKDPSAEDEASYYRIRGELQLLESEWQRV